MAQFNHSFLETLSSVDFQHTVLVLRFTNWSFLSPLLVPPSLPTRECWECPRAQPPSLGISSSLLALIALCDSHMYTSSAQIDPVQEGFWRQPLLAVLDAVPPLLVTEKQCGMCLWMQLLVLNGGGDTKSINHIISKYRSFLFLGYF